MRRAHLHRTRGQRDPASRLTLDGLNQVARRYLQALTTVEAAVADMSAAKRAALALSADVRARHRYLAANQTATAASQRCDQILETTAAWLWDVIADPVLRELNLPSVGARATAASPHPGSQAATVLPSSLPAKGVAIRRGRTGSRGSTPQARSVAHGHRTRGPEVARLPACRSRLFHGRRPPDSKASGYTNR